ncbi:MAG: ABC transporter ATP-binding protein [Kiloniellales bacterium]
MATLELIGVNKHYGGIAALDNVDLRIEDNEFFCIFGPPSCGKTSVLKVLLGLIAADSGEVRIDGTEVTESRPRERDLGMVFQNLALFPHLTASKNIAFPLEERKWPRADIRPRVDAVAKTLHISHLLKKLPAQLSGGERQRVAIARALVRNPKAYLMDEPIAALDARLRETTRVELKRLQRELKHTLVYVTHDQEEAMSIADRIAIMREGAIVQVGSPEEIYNRPANRFVAETVGSPRINVLEGRIADGLFSAAALPESLRFSGVADGAVALAIRPEDLVLLPESAEGEVVPAIVDEVEPLGGHTVIDLAMGGITLRAHQPGQPDYSPGQAIKLAIDPKHCHIFDGVTGEALSHAT